MSRRGKAKKVININKKSEQQLLDPIEEKKDDHNDELEHDELVV
jgi:hypothetical protein